MIANAATVEITRKADVIFSRRLGGASISTIRFGWTGLALTGSLSSCFRQSGAA
jgi:hypothetical protein